MNIFNLPIHVPTRLVTDPNDERVPTQEVDTDATTALTRGLAEYMAQLKAVDGTPAFRSSFDSWAEPEDLAEYPAFIAYTNDRTGEYEAANLSPLAELAPTTSGASANGLYEVSSSSLGVEIACEVWANDPEQRMRVMAALEPALEPVTWMQGFRLELPHYFAQRATYRPMSVTYLGGAAEARQRVLVARVVVHGTVPKTRLLPIPIARAPVVRDAGVAPGPLTPPPGAIRG